jgi:hypothetical protein
MTGPLTGKVIPVPVSGVCIGRGAVNPEDRKCSRFHARVTPLNGSVKAKDLKTVNRLLFCGKRRKRVRLALGDEVTLGGTTVRCITKKEREDK